MTPTANLASAKADADHSAAPTAEAESFVLNLCSSTTPMALPQSDLPDLKRFTFFISRRFEEGRERFRLHMGFFGSLAEAEEWLGLAREIYPGAWAGEAPGKKLRARATAAAATQAGHAVGPQRTAAPAAPARAAAPVPAAIPTPAAAGVSTAAAVSTRAPVPTPAAASAAPAPIARPAAQVPAAAPAIPKLVPTLHPPAAAVAAVAPKIAAPAAGAARAPAPQSAKAAPQALAKRPPAPGPVPRAVAPAAARAMPQPPTAPRQVAAARPTDASPLQPRTAPAPAAGQRPAASAGAAAARPAGQPAVVTPAAAANPAAPALARSAALLASRAVQQPVRKPIFADSNVKEVLAALDAPEDGTGETRLMPAPMSLSENVDDSTLTDTQVLRFLETRRADDGGPREQLTPQADPAAETSISLLKPDDTGTRRALKEAVSHNEPVSFVVQLQWSVQPVELEKVPPLAIFSAYTLYSVEGSREGRKWYGLRLGFFSDAISAKQVAHYVRSEFTSVAVVPVSPEERERASEDNQRLSGVGAARRPRQSEDHGIKLIDDAPRVLPGTPAAAPAPAAAPPAAARAARKSGGKVGARERRTPQTLEETLEILGANELAIDNADRDPMNDSGVRHLRVEVQKNTPFSRLLERLSERVRKA